MNGTTIGRAISALILLGGVSGGVHAATQTRTSAFTYNAYGQIEKEVVEPDDSDYCVVKFYEYNTSGNRTGVTTRNCD